MKNIVRLQRFWKELQELDKPKTKKDATEADRIMINGKITKTDDETVKEQTKYTATLEVMDYNEELGIELTQEDKEYPIKMNCFQDWREQVIEAKWKKEDENKSKLRKAIQYVSNKNIRLLPQFRQKYPDYSNSSSKIS